MTSEYIADYINFEQLEEELKRAIKAEEKYVCENNAKLRAISQRVQTYEDFQDLVKAAHLKPLKKSDGINSAAKTVWNSAARNGNQITPLVKKAMADLNSKQVDSLESLQELERRWRHHMGNPRQQFFYLRCLGSERAKMLCNHFDLLAGVVEALTYMEDTLEDFCFVIDVLNSLSRAKRFALSLRFLSDKEKELNRELFQKLWKCMANNQQDLAERDITELTLNNLMQRYQVENCKFH